MGDRVVELGAAAGEEGGRLDEMLTLSADYLEREMEFATLRALGYHRGKISRIVMAELVAQAASAVLLSMPLAALLAFFINYQQGKIYFLIPTVVRPAEVLGASAWALLFAPLAGLPGLRYLFKLNIAEVVRQKVMG